jgi:hypothetical protein
MPDCDYCGASFDDEAADLDDLAADHEERELGSIDRRRVADHDGGDDGGFPLGPAVLIGLLVFAGGLVVYVTFIMGGGGTAAASGLPDSGDPSVISQVSTEPATSNDHVEQGTDIDYETVPPTSGPHYSSRYTVEAGFYTDRQPLGGLVHSIEHGAVVVYYDPAGLSDDAESHLRSYAGNYTGAFQSFVAVPTPVDDPDSTYVLTTWEKRYTMDTYDPDAVRAFTAEYLGRGPEQTVR